MLKENLTYLHCFVHYNISMYRNIFGQCIEKSCIIPSLYLLSYNTSTYSTLLWVTCSMSTCLVCSLIYDHSIQIMNAGRCRTQSFVPGVEIVHLIGRSNFYRQSKSVPVDATDVYILYKYLMIQQFPHHLILGWFILILWLRSAL